MAKDQQTTEEKTEQPLGSLPAFSFVEMVDEKWYKCTDVNVELNARRSKVGILLEKCEYDHAEGIGDRACKTFTVRQYYRDGSPTLDYTGEQVELMIRGWKRHIENDNFWQQFDDSLRRALKEFERLYKGLGADMERKGHSIKQMSVDDQNAAGLTSKSGPNQ